MAKLKSEQEQNASEDKKRVAAGMSLLGHAGDFKEAMRPLLASEQAQRTQEVSGDSWHLGLIKLSDGSYELKLLGRAGDPRLIGQKRDGVEIGRRAYTIYVLNGYKPTHDSKIVHWAKATASDVTSAKKFA